MTPRSAWLSKKRRRADSNRCSGRDALFGLKPALQAANDLQHAGVDDASNLGNGSQAYAVGVGLPNGDAPLLFGSSASLRGPLDAGEGHLDLFVQRNRDHEVGDFGFLAASVYASDFQRTHDGRHDLVGGPVVICGDFDVQVDQDGAGHLAPLVGFHSGDNSEQLAVCQVNIAGAA